MFCSRGTLPELVIGSVARHLAPPRRRRSGHPLYEASYTAHRLLYHSPVDSTRLVRARTSSYSTSSYVHRLERNTEEDPLSRCQAPAQSQFAPRRRVEVACGAQQEAPSGARCLDLPQPLELREYDPGHKIRCDDMFAGSRFFSSKNLDTPLLDKTKFKPKISTSLPNTTEYGTPQT